MYSMIVMPLKWSVGIFQFKVSTYFILIYNIKCKFNYISQLQLTSQKYCAFGIYWHHYYLVLELGQAPLEIAVLISAAIIS